MTYYMSDASLYTADAGGKVSPDKLFEFTKEVGTEKAEIKLSAEKQQMIDLLRQKLIF